MRRPDALFSISLALGAMSLASEAATREEGPTEIEKCQTISKPGSYVLVNNLTANGDCLVITSPRGRVTIDLAGFSISGIGPITGGGSGISADGVEQGALAVRNGTISDFGTGVNFGGTRGSIIEGLRVSNCLEGISAFGIIRGNSVVGNGTGIVGRGTITWQRRPG